MDVGAWLGELGLEQYEAAFRENAVDAEVLPTLTGEELKDMLEAIAALRPEGAPLSLARRLTRSGAPVPPRPSPSAARSASCSATSLAPPRFLPGSILRICAS